MSNQPPAASPEASAHAHAPNARSASKVGGASVVDPTTSLQSERVILEDQAMGRALTMFPSLRDNSL